MKKKEDVGWEVISTPLFPASNIKAEEERHDLLLLNADQTVKQNTETAKTASPRKTRL